MIDGRSLGSHVLELLLRSMPGFLYPRHHEGRIMISGFPWDQCQRLFSLCSARHDSRPNPKCLICASGFCQVSRADSNKQKSMQKVWAAEKQRHANTISP